LTSSAAAAAMRGYLAIAVSGRLAELRDDFPLPNDVSRKEAARSLRR